MTDKLYILNELLLLITPCKYRDALSLKFTCFSSLVLPLCHFRKKEPSTCFTNSIEERFKLIADFVESEFLYPFKISLDIVFFGVSVIFSFMII